MRNKTVSYTMFIFVCIFLLGYAFMVNLVMPSGEPIKGQLKDIATYARLGKWNEAERTANSFEKTWSGVKYIIALNYAEADYTKFVELTGQLQADVAARNAGSVIIDAYTALELWDNFLKLIPLP